MELPPVIIRARAQEKEVIRCLCGRLYLFNVNLGLKAILVTTHSKLPPTSKSTPFILEVQYKGQY